MSLAQSSSKSWWNSRLNSKQSSATLRENKSTLNSLASAIGLRSKKTTNLPTLAIGDPQPVYKQPASARSTTGTFYTNRPPSKSISSTIDDRESSIGPSTPSDLAPRSRQSLLTLSDTDPFAATTRVVTDPTRLSTYSDSSKQRHDPANNRSSYASSSNTGHTNPNSITDYPRTRKLSLRSRSSFELEPPPVPKVPATASSVNKSQQGRRGLPDCNEQASRPYMRSRCMTDAASNVSRPFFDQQRALPAKMQPRPDTLARAKSSPAPPQPPPPFSPPMPTTIVRQASMSKNGLSLPPTAPPALSLPTPPLSATDDSTPDSSISFASSRSSPDLIRTRSLRHKSSRIKGDYPQMDVSLVHTPKEQRRARVMDYDDNDDIYDPVLPRNPSTSRLPVPDQTPPLCVGKSLKKATSHQNFAKSGKISFAPAQSPPRDNGWLSYREEVEKSPKKQRPSNQHRMPMPNLPYPLSHSPIETQPASPSFTRKRLFSGGSKRPSTATSILSNAVDDDDYTPSAFSLPPEHDIVTTSSISVFPTPPQAFSRGPRSSTAALSWNDLSSSQVSSAHEYAPQRIMSPAEMLKVEASVLSGEDSPDIGGYTRSRGVSITSTSTSTSWWEREREREREMASNSTPLHQGRIQEGLTSPLSLTRSISASVTYGGPGSSGLAALPGGKVAARPSTSQGTSMVASLPPPPRRRPGTGSGGPQLMSSPSISSSIRSTDTHGSNSSHSHSTHSTVIPRHPPPTAYKTEELRKKRQSLMRKPSFLDIEDDEAEIVYPITPSSEPELFNPRVSSAFGDHSISSSFLNLRDSFDTIRGSDE